MLINVSIPTRKPQKISFDEVRTELRKIEEEMFGKLLDQASLNNLNLMLDSRINKPYGLKIRAEFINNNVKLYGYTDESKEVLDPNYKKDYISKTR